MVGAMHADIIGRHGKAPFGTIVTVTLRNGTGRSVRVKIIDNGPNSRLTDRVIDLSRGAFKKLVGSLKFPETPVSVSDSPRSCFFPSALSEGGLRTTPKRSIVLPEDGPSHSSPRPSLARSVVTPPS